MLFKDTVLAGEEGKKKMLTMVAARIKSVSTSHEFTVFDNNNNNNNNNK
jgi:hypothetical protein